MVVKRRLLLAISAGLTLAIVGARARAGRLRRLPARSARAAGPASASQDIASSRKTAGVGPVVAVGWRQAAKPGELFVTFSTDGGHSFLKQNGTLRQFRVAGDGHARPVAGRLRWPHLGGHGRATTRVTTPPTGTSCSRSRTIGGQAGQAFVTDAAGDRTARQVSVACVGNRLLAVAWVENSLRQGARQADAAQPRAARRARRASARSSASARRCRKGGIAVDASTDSVHVAWTAGQKRERLLRALPHRRRRRPGHHPGRHVKLAAGDALYPQVAARGQKVVVAYTDAGKVKARVSGDGGTHVRRPSLVVGTGHGRAPSQAHSADVSGSRIVVEATASTAGIADAAAHLRRTTRARPGRRATSGTWAPASARCARRARRRRCSSRPGRTTRRASTPCAPSTSARLSGRCHRP